MSFAAIRGGIEQQLAENWPEKARKVINDFNARSAFKIPAYKLSFGDPRAGVASICDEFAGGRHHIMWQFYDVLEANGILPKHPHFKRFDDCSEWNLRPAGVMPYGRNAPAPKLTFEQIEGYLRQILESGFPRNISSVVDEWNAKLFEPTQYHTYGYDPRLSASDFLGQFYGRKDEQRIMRGQLYIIMKDLGFMMRINETYVQWSDLDEWIDLDARPSIARPVASGPLPLIPAPKRPNPIDGEDTVNNGSKPLCAICQEHDVKVSSDCGHTLCRSCARQLPTMTCPHCRDPITSFRLVFFT